MLLICRQPLTARVGIEIKEGGILMRSYNGMKSGDGVVEFTTEEGALRALEKVARAVVCLDETFILCIAAQAGDSRAMD